MSVCGDPVVLLDVSPVGKRARLTGIARKEFAGQLVTIQRAGKRGRHRDGRRRRCLLGLVDGPASGEAPPVAYMAWIGRNHSRAFRYDRYLRITKRSGLKITGKLALKRLPKTVTLLRVNACTGKSTSTTAKVDQERQLLVHHARPRRGLPVRPLPRDGEAGRHGQDVLHAGRRGPLTVPGRGLYEVPDR